MIAAYLKSMMVAQPELAYMQDLLHTEQVIEVGGYIDPQALEDLYALLRYTDGLASDASGQAARSEARAFARTVADAMEIQLAAEGGDYAGIQALNIALMRKTLDGGSVRDLARLVALTDEADPICVPSEHGDYMSDDFNLVITPRGTLVYTPTIDDDQFFIILDDMSHGSTIGYGYDTRAEAEFAISTWLITGSLEDQVLAA